MASAVAAVPPKHLVIGTAGHVDHGKTALIRALTGSETDRLPEERARGISIDLGFAHFTLPGGQPAAIIDVPGHERFVHNMLAGAVGIDIGLLVVAADEGVMPQTAEHIAILDLLQLRHGVIALTKCDLVEPDWLELVRATVTEAVAGTFLASAPIVPVSAVTGAGIPALVAELTALAAQARGRDSRGLPRLPVDRVFTRPGFGTVVTGTLVAGRLSLQDKLELLPGSVPVRVRGLQVHGEQVTTAVAGQRVAVNLQGVDHADVRRGHVLAAPGAMRPGQSFAGSLELLPGSVAPLRHGARVHLHVGTAETVARVVLLGQDELQPGAAGFAIFRCERPVVVARHDRFILRSYSPVTTIGGGAVLEPHAAFRRSNATALAALQRLAAGGPRIVVSEVLRQAGPQPLRLGQLVNLANLDELTIRQTLAELEQDGEAVPLAADAYLHVAGLAVVQQRIVDHIAAALQQQLLHRGVPREQLRTQAAPQFDGRLFGLLLDRLQAADVITVQREQVRLAGGAPALPDELTAAVAAVVRALREGGLSPPGPGELSAKLAQPLPAGVTVVDILQYLTDGGAVVHIAEQIWLHADAVAAAAERVTSKLAAVGEATMATLRDALGTSRKFAVPLLEHFDRQGITYRDGDVRRLGPAASRVRQDDTEDD